HVVQQLYALLQDKIPIIGVGGIMNEASAREKLNAGASLLQIYSGFIYKGPALTKKLAAI
ncbi:MAG: quinone-dependent dihydroorotate dehydrogenase, partial [Gammaproteobacteria bacterium]